MNNKGFAITTVVYSILILLALFMFIILGNLRNEYSNQKEFTSGINEELNNYLNPDIELPPSCNIEITGSGVERLLTIKTSAVSLDTNPYSWISETEGFSKTNTKTVSANGIYTGYVKSSTGLVGNCSCEVNNIIINSDTSGANEPDLATGMIPVYYDGAVWRKADSRNGAGTYRWYSYELSGDKKGMWANAVTVDVLNATIKNKYFNNDMSIKVENGTKEAPGAINVTFVNTSTAALDAFWWDEDSDGIQDTGEQKAGFWYGKFETSSDIVCSPTTYSHLERNCNLSTIKPKIIPNVTSWRGAQVSTYFTTSRNMEDSNNMYGFVSSEVDTHMSKNNEWGAVAYLTHSIYGRCSSGTSCTEVTINNCSTYITGIGGDTVDAAISDSTCTTAVNQYNGAVGKLASTTGTIYGIYDMSGGAWDFVMGNFATYSGQKLEYNQNSGFNGAMYEGDPLITGIPFPESKYVNVYTGTSYIGHALSETLNWYRDIETYISSTFPWFCRGGYNDYKKASGIFNFGHRQGGTEFENTSRITLVK